MTDTTLFAGDKLFNLVSDEMEDSDAVSVIESHMTDRIELYNTMPAATKKHHAWPGGYADHVREVVKFTLQIHDEVLQHPHHELPKRDDFIIAAFLHDLDKLFRYEHTSNSCKNALHDPRTGKVEHVQAFQYRKMSDINTTALVVHYTHQEGMGRLIDNQAILNAITYHHGGWAIDASSLFKQGDKLEPLAAILHAADLTSAFVIGRTYKI